MKEIKLFDKNCKLIQINNSYSRPHYELIGAEEIRYKIKKNNWNENSFKKFIEEGEGKNKIKLLENKTAYEFEYPEDSNNYYDCRDWLFDKIKLHQYTHREGGILASKLVTEDFPEIKLTTTPKENGVIAYTQAGIVKHWGLIKSVNKGIEIISKWGPGGVYWNYLENISEEYGNEIYFFELIK